MFTIKEENGSPKGQWPLQLITARAQEQRNGGFDPSPHGAVCAPAPRRPAFLGNHWPLLASFSSSSASPAQLSRRSFWKATTFPSAWTDSQQEPTTWAQRLSNCCPREEKPQNHLMLPVSKGKYRASSDRPSFGEFLATELSTSQEHFQCLPFLWLHWYYKNPPCNLQSIRTLPSRHTSHSTPITKLWPTHTRQSVVAHRWSFCWRINKKSMKSATSIGIHFETKHVFMCPRQFDILQIKDFTLFPVQCKDRGFVETMPLIHNSKPLLSALRVRKRGIHKQRSTNESFIPRILHKKKNDTLTGNSLRRRRKE